MTKARKAFLLMGAIALGASLSAASAGRAAQAAPTPGRALTPLTVTNHELYGVSADSSTDAWAVGCDYDSTTSTDSTRIMHWNGTVWSKVKSPNPGTSGACLSGVSALSATDAWAAGTYSGGADPALERYGLVEGGQPQSRPPARRHQPPLRGERRLGHRRLGGRHLRRQQRIRPADRALERRSLVEGLTPGMFKRAAIGRWPSPPALASSAAPMTSMLLARRGTHQAGSSTWVRPQAAQRARSGWISA
jgi:hypothetical protein